VVYLRYNRDGSLDIDLKNPSLLTGLDRIISILGIISRVDFAHQESKTLLNVNGNIIKYHSPYVGVVHGDATARANASHYQNDYTELSNRLPHDKETEEVWLKSIKVYNPKKTETKYYESDNTEEWVVNTAFINFRDSYGGRFYLNVNGDNVSIYEDTRGSVFNTVYESLNPGKPINEITVPDINSSPSIYNMFKQTGMPGGFPYSNSFVPVNNLLDPGENVVVDVVSDDPVIGKCEDEFIIPYNNRNVRRYFINGEWVAVIDDDKLRKSWPNSASLYRDGFVDGFNIPSTGGIDSLAPNLGYIKDILDKNKVNTKEFLYYWKHPVDISIPGFENEENAIVDSEGAYITQMQMNQTLNTLIDLSLSLAGPGVFGTRGLAVLGDLFINIYSQNARKADAMKNFYNNPQHMIGEYVLLGQSSKKSIKIPVENYKGNGSENHSRRENPYLTLPINKKFKNIASVINWLDSQPFIRELFPLDNLFDKYTSKSFVTTQYALLEVKTFDGNTDNYYVYGVNGAMTMKHPWNDRPAIRPDLIQPLKEVINNV